MSETLALALVTGASGLGGALIGVFATLALERRRERRERAGVFNTIRMDVIRWREACLSLADEWNIRAHQGQAIAWTSFAPLATVHLPFGLSALFFRLYQAREQSESAYAELVRGVPEQEVAQAFSARFSLRRWALMARAVLEEWNRYDRRSRWRKLAARVRPDRLEKAGLEAEASAHARVVRRTGELLEGEYGYKVSEDLELAPENHNREAYDTMMREFQSVRAFMQRPTANHENEQGSEAATR